MNQVLLVLAGGGIGSAGRYLVGMALTGRFGTVFPWGTLAVNIAGSFLIGLFAALADEAKLLGPSARLFLITGILGGFTTFSAFSLETVRLAETGAGFRAVANLVASLGLSVAAAVAGLAIGRLYEQ